MVLVVLVGCVCMCMGDWTDGGLYVTGCVFVEGIQAGEWYKRGGLGFMLG